MATPPPSVSTPPGTAGSAAKPISQSELQQELKPTPQKATFSEPGKGTTRIGGDPGKIEDNEIPFFGKAARQMMAEKAAEAKAAPAAKETPKEEPAPKKEASAPVKEEKAAPAPAAKEEKADEDPPEDERRVLPHDKPATAKRIGYFLRNEAMLKKEVAAVRAELEAAKKAPPTAANAEEVAKLKADLDAAQNDLGRFRRRYDLDNDPGFKAKYDEPVAQLEAGIESTLKRVGFQDATINAIKAEGGFGAFSRSGKVFTVTETVDGEPKKVQRTAAELARAWLDAVPLEDAEFIKAGVGRQRLLAEERKGAIDTESANFKKWEEERKAGQTQAQAQQEAANKAATEEYQAWHAATLKDTPWLQDAEVPANATEEQRAAIGERNEFTKQLRAGLSKHPKNAKEYTAMILDATYSHHLRRELGEAQARIKALEAKAEQQKEAQRTTPRSGSLLTGGQPKGEPEEQKGDPTDIRAAMRRSFQKIADRGSED